MSEVLGEVSALENQVVRFNAVIRSEGATKSGAVNLSECTGLSQYMSSHAKVELLSDLTASVICPTKADKAAHAHVAVIPSSVSRLPTDPEGVLTIPGSALCEHSIFAGQTSQPLGFAPDVTSLLKPTALVGSPPKVVYHITIIGGAPTDVAYIKISGSVRLAGVGFVPAY